MEGWKGWVGEVGLELKLGLGLRLLLVVGLVVREEGQGSRLARRQ